MPLTTILRPAFATVLALLTLPASAAAAPTWLAPERLSEPMGHASGLAGHSRPNVAMSASGEAVVVWSGRTDQNTFILWARTRPPGSTWSSRQGITLTRTYPRPLGDTPPPALAMDAEGNAIVAYEYVVGAERWVRAVFRPSGGAFTPPVTLSESDSSTLDPAVAMNARGDAVVVWRRNGFLQASVRPAAGSFGAAQNVSTATEAAYHPEVAIGDNGTAVAAWARDANTARAAVRPPGGPWGMPQDISGTSAFVEDLDVAVDPVGRVTAVWAARSGDLWRTEGASRSTTGVWTPALTLSSQTSSYSTRPKVVVDRQNVAVAAWYRGSGVVGVLESSTRLGGGSFSTPQPISANGAAIDSDNFSLAGDGTGGVIAAWHQSAPLEAQAARRPPGGTFGAVESILPPGAPLLLSRVAADAAGNAAAAFLESPLGTSSVHVAGFDFAPPTLGTVTVAPAGTVGEPLAVSAAPADVWSAVTTAWSFGDGATATGTSATHAYTTPGVYNVTVTATDAVGNSAAATRAVLIAPQPAASPEPTPASTPAPPASTPSPPPVVVPATGIDRDGDGFLAGQDCNDDDSAIRPGATEIRGNRTDENCDGSAEPFPTLGSGVVTRWSVHGADVRLTALQITQRFPRGWQAQIRCKGARCPFKAKGLKAGKVRRGAASVIASLRPRQRRFRAGQTVEIWVSAPGYNTKVARYVLRRGRIPTTQPLCARPGETSPQRACD